MGRFMRQGFILATLLLAPMLGCSAPDKPDEGATLTLRQLSEPAAQWGRIELAVEGVSPVKNPFDPAEADLRVVFSGPDSQTLSVPAFWYQDFDPATLAPRGAAGWRVRFSPPRPGLWTAQASLAQPALHSQALPVQVAPASERHGMLRINPRNPRYFAFDDGTFFFPIGPNMGWSTRQGAGTLQDYQRWLDQLSANGGNATRIWMASWSFGIEWKDTGLGDYKRRLRQAWLLDQVFQMAEQRHVNIMLTLLNHGAFSTTTNAEWKDNPYNRANGGMLAAPEEFATNPEARALFKRRVRYMAARWAAAPNLFAWEWWNEVNWTPLDDARLKPWYQEMTAELRRHDPYGHLVSTSYSSASLSRLWGMPELQFAQQHDYEARDLSRTLPAAARELSREVPDKPLLLAELGLSAGGEDKSPLDREQIQLHNGLWAAPFSGFAGASMHWWWDTYIDPRHRWGEYKGIATFMQGQDLSDLKPGKAGLSGPGAVALTLQGRERALAWVRSDAYELVAATSAYERVLRERKSAGWTYQPPTLDGLTLTIESLEDGDYQAAWFDPRSAAWQPAKPVRVQNGTLTIGVPSLTYDLALKIAR
jgi:hypothetical protein